MTSTEVLGSPVKSVAAPAERLRHFLLVAFIVAMPVTGEWALGSKRMNLAASDLVTPFGVLFLMALALKRELRLPGLALFCFNVLAIAASLLLNFSDTLEAKGLVGVVVELIKIVSLWLQFYFAVNMIRSRADFRLALKAWCLGSAGISLLGIYGSLSWQLTGVENPYALMFRAQSTLGDSNLFASYLSLSFLLGILLCRLDRTVMRWMVPVWAILVTGIFLSASRGTMLAFSIVLGTLVVFSMSWRGRIALGAGLIAVVALAAAIPDRDALLTSNPYTERLATATVDVNDEAALDRKELWGDALDRFSGAPIFGIGRGNFRLKNQPDPSATGQVHDTFLGIACETGLVGVLAYALAFSRYAIELLVDRLRARNKLPLPTRTMLCCFMILMLCGLTISIENFRGLWIVIGLMESYRRLYGAYGSGASMDVAAA